MEFQIQFSFFTDEKKNGDLQCSDLTTHPPLVACWLSESMQVYSPWNTRLYGFNLFWVACPGLRRSASFQVTAALEEVGIEFVSNFLSYRGNTTKGLSDLLQTRHPGKRGFGVRSIQRFCQEHGIKRKGFISNESLDQLVRGAVSQASFRVQNMLIVSFTHEMIAE